jgi:uncharacterized protein
MIVRRHGASAPHGIKGNRMSTRDTAWPQGTPCWVDLMVASDLEASRDFYGKVLGWEYQVSGPEMGYYSIALAEDRAAAGLGQMPPDQPAPPVAWTTYLAVDDIDAVCTSITEHGGQVHAPPMPVGEQGSMAIAMDPTGAVFGLWKAGQHTGAQIVNQPGGVVWNDLMTRDPDRAREFYAAVFGYEYQPMGGDFDYSTIVGEGPGGVVGGLGAMMPDTPSEVPAHWRTYFSVTDVPATVAAATAAGGTVISEPSPTPWGLMAELRDPQGATFTVGDGNDLKQPSS